MARRHFCLVFVLLLAGALVTPSWAATDACSLLSPQQVSDVLGAQVGADKNLVPGNTATCVWNTSGGGKSAILALYTQLGPRSPMDRFNLAKTPVPNVEKTPVGGIGDEAFYSTAGHITALVVRKGNTPFHVEVRGFSPDEIKQKEKTLAGEVLAKL